MCHLGDLQGHALVGAEGDAERAQVVYVADLLPGAHVGLPALIIQSLLSVRIDSSFAGLGFAFALTPLAIYL
jgi:hypothetical protein